MNDERELIDRMLAGDELAMEAFGDTYFPPLYRYALGRLSGRTDLARDLVQSTVVKALGKLGTFRGEAPLIAWLRACCRNEIAMHFRREGTVAMLDEGDHAAPDLATVPNPRAIAGQEQVLLSRESSELVHETLDTIPPHYARALELKYLERLPVKEIAARLALGPKAVESILTRARGAFRRCWQEKLNAPGPSRLDGKGRVSA